MSAPTSPERSPTAAAPLLVACLCAAWCRTCDSYRDTLATARDDLCRTHPHVAARFMWVDIEDESALVGDLDIEDFPTLLVARGDAILFFGPVLPHAQTIERLLRSVIDGAPALATASLAADVVALPERLGSHATI